MEDESCRGIQPIPFQQCELTKREADSGVRSGILGVPRPPAAAYAFRWAANMRHIIFIISLLFSVSLVSCGGHVDNLNTNDATPVFRTDFTDEATWRKIQRDVAATNVMGFSANVQFIDERQYSGLTGQELLQRIPGLNEYGCIFVADTMAMSTVEHHLLVLDPSNPEGKTFRVIPSEAWGVENNLSLANMDYSEFANAADSDDVFRGFK